MMSSYYLVFFSLLFSAFFSGMEIAFISRNKLKLELDSTKNSLTAKLLSYITNSSSDFISTMLIGNNICLVIFGISFAKIIEPILYVFFQQSAFVFLAQTLISTFIVLIAAELLPKIFFLISPNRYLNYFVLPLSFFFFLFKPFVYLVSSIINIFWKKFTKEEDNMNFDKEDLDEFLQTIDDDNDVIELDMLKNALEFPDIIVRECMIPRNEIIAVNANDEIRDLNKVFKETKLSKILVYKENIDNIIGYVHALELLKKPISIRSILLPIQVFSETLKIQKVFKMLNDKHQSIGLIVDEFGATSGIITIEDIIEEIFGEISDEHDLNEMEEIKIDDYNFIFSSRLEIDYLNSKYNLDFKLNPSYETLSGFILYHHESIPNPNDLVLIDNYIIKILKSDQNKIHKVKITKQNKIFKIP